MLHLPFRLRSRQKLRLGLGTSTSQVDSCFLMSRKLLVLENLIKTVPVFLANIRSHYLLYLYEVFGLEVMSEK